MKQWDGNLFYNTTLPTRLFPIWNTTNALDLLEDNHNLKSKINKTSKHPVTLKTQNYTVNGPSLL